MRGLRRGGKGFILGLSLAFALVLLGGFHTRAKAQADTLLTIWVGGHGHFGINNATFIPYQPVSSGTTFGMGVDVRLSIWRYFAMLAELNYSHAIYHTVETVQRPNNPFYPDTQVSCKTNSVELPVLMQLMYSYRMLYLSAVGGPYLDYTLTEHFGPTGSEIRQRILHSTHNRWGFGLMAGAAIGINTPIGTFYGYYRLRYRLNNMYQRYLLPESDENRQSTTSHVGGIGYCYPFEYRRYKTR